MVCDADTLQADGLQDHGRGRRVWRHGSGARREGPGVQSGLLSPEGQWDQFPSFPANGLLLFPSFLVKSIVIAPFSVIETEAQGS